MFILIIFQCTFRLHILHAHTDVFVIYYPGKYAIHLTFVQNYHNYVHHSFLMFMRSFFNIGLYTKRLP